MVARQSRQFNRWALAPPSGFAATKTATAWYEGASTGLLLESLRRHAEIQSIGRRRFTGSLATRNRLWVPYRNYLRQAMNNYSAALGVPNRSACLLYYYALLNFAKAELLDGFASKLVDEKIGHGLSFHPARARTIKGDYLTVQDGVFPLLYERRTGYSFPAGTRLPITRVLANIPEIGQQLEDSGNGASKCAFGFLMTASDETHTWLNMIIGRSNLLDGERATQALLNRHFDEVVPLPDWRDRFGFTRRSLGFDVKFFESRRKFAHSTAGERDLIGPNSVMQSLSDILGLRTDEMADFVISPYLFKTRKLPMPPSLARYAVSFYASSLVRYRPQMFDFQLYPQHAYLFDAIARECALPMLIDTLSNLDGVDHLFFSSGSLRV